MWQPTISSDELYHHGIEGMKWGVRRYQNEDGTLTSAGRKRYGINSNGWYSSEGKKQWKKDRKENDDKFAEELKNIPKDKRWAAFRKFATEMDTKSQKDFYKQEKIERAYKEYSDLVKRWNNDLTEGKHEIEIAVNKYGQMTLREVDEKFRTYKQSGYNTVKSMSDIMNTINIDDVSYNRKIYMDKMIF